MAHFATELSPELTDFIARQPIFFTATAAASGRINLSPKGMRTLRVLGPKQVAYLDLTGSGNETAAHLRHDGRLTLMFASFDDRPLILRLYGRGRVVRPADSEWLALVGHFEELPGTRQIVVLELESLQTSCGGAVPRLEFVADRQALVQWATSKGPEALAAYRAEKNVRSIDGLPIG